MKKRLQGFIAGILCCSLFAGISVLAKTGSEWIEAYYNDVKIYVDGKKVNPKDVNGNTVEPFVYNGTTYLPVRAVGNAIGKEVYWDGETSSVFLGNMDGALEYPSAYLEDMQSINQKLIKAPTLTDNYGNVYDNGVIPVGLEYILNSKYSKFKGTFYIPEGTTTEYGEKTYLQITADDKIIYKSPVVDKTSKPIDVDVNVKGCNVFKITIKHDGNSTLNFQPCIANSGFYQ